jgi:hypothetical protein
MKHLRLVLCLATALFVSHTSAVLADSYDSDDATVKKATDSTAKVTVDKSTYVVPVSFGDGASWDNVHDHYELSDGSVACLKSKHAKVSVGSDGTLSWSK